MQPQFTLQEVQILQDRFKFNLTNATFLYFNSPKNFDMTIHRIYGGYKVEIYDIIENKQYIHEYKTWTALLKKLLKIPGDLNTYWLKTLLELRPPIK